MFVSVLLSVCVSACACPRVCVYVCVQERERERERKCVRGKEVSDVLVSFSNQASQRLLCLCKSAGVIFPEEVCVCVCVGVGVCVCVWQRRGFWLVVLRLSLLPWQHHRWQ